MAAVTIQNVMKQFGTRVVLEGASLELHEGETVGLIGPNGAGKTTLFRLINGDYPPDLGTITRSRGLQHGYLQQEPEVSADRTLHEEVGSVFEELLALETKCHELSEELARRAHDPDVDDWMRRYDRVHDQFVAAGGHTFETRMNEILGGLGFTESEQHRPMSTFSGGQRCRAALAKLLLEDRTLLLLDEPTNHLDIDAVRWLEKFLTSHQGGAVIISHDRYLLDRLCDRIIELENRKLFSYPGNYTTFAETKQLVELTRQRQYEKDAVFIAKEKDFIAKHLAGQRSAQAKGRRKRLTRQLSAGEFVTEGVGRKASAARIEFGGREAKAGTLVRCEGLTMGYGGRPLFHDLDLSIRGGERLGITGPNGTGKTTLLRILVGQLTPQAGSVRFEERVQIGFHSQERPEGFSGRSILEEIRQTKPGMSEFDGRTYAAKFLFRGNEVFKPLELLSGGEQSRVRLATLVLQAPDVLILDEPTNHLDIPSREVLEEALEDFVGTVIVVSHDRYFLDRIVDRLFVMRAEGCTMYAGNYTTYVEQVEREQAEKRAALEGKAATKKAKRAKNEKLQAASTRTPYDHLAVEQLEAMVVERETALAALTAKFGDPAVCKDPDALSELRDEVEIAERALTEVDRAWQQRART